MAEFRKTSYRFARSNSTGHPVIVVGESKDELLVIPTTTKKIPGKGRYERFRINFNSNSKDDNYWQRRVQPQSKKMINDYSTWSLDKEDKEKIDAFVKDNSRSKKLLG